MVYHGGARENEIGLIDFSYSVNPYRPPFLKRLLNSDLTVYPYCESLEEKLKEKYKIDEEVVIGAGITELLYMVSYALKKKRAMFMLHTYGEYERMADLFGMKKNFIKDIDPDLTSFKIENGIVFFANPNNPTGKYYRNIEELFQIAERNNSIVVLDEAFIDFSKWKTTYYPDNVIVLRSFTKSFGLPGIRAGYAFGDKKIIKRMRDFRMPWSLGVLGCKFIDFAIKNDYFLKISIEKIWKERERIEKLTGLKTHANFFLADAGFPGLREILKKKGILVRDCSSFKLPNAIRFSIKKRYENDLLLEELKNFDLKILEGLNYEI
ncbi:MAG: aminotransferase class I/II-fold pyridoxal phosphate-dependent enzyme [Thermoplasmata archaeon]